MTNQAKVKPTVQPTVKQANTRANQDNTSQQMIAVDWLRGYRLNVL